MPGKTAFCACFLEDLFAAGMTNGNSGSEPSEERLHGLNSGTSSHLHA